MLEDPPPIRVFGDRGFSLSKNGDSSLIICHGAISRTACGVPKSEISPILAFGDQVPRTKPTVAHLPAV